MEGQWEASPGPRTTLAPCRGCPATSGSHRPDPGPGRRRDPQREPALGWRRERPAMDGHSAGHSTGLSWHLAESPARRVCRALPAERWPVGRRGVKGGGLCLPGKQVLRLEEEGTGPIPLQFGTVVAGVAGAVSTRGSLRLSPLPCAWTAFLLLTHVHTHTTHSHIPLTQTLHTHTHHTHHTHTLITYTIHTHYMLLHATHSHKPLT